MDVYIYLYMYIYIYTYVFLDIYTHIYRYSWHHISVHLFVYKCTSILCMCVRVCLCVCIYRYIYTYKHKYTYIFNNTKCKEFLTKETLHSTETINRCHPSNFWKRRRQRRWFSSKHWCVAVECSVVQCVGGYLLQCVAGCALTRYSLKEHVVKVPNMWVRVMIL